MKQCWIVVLLAIVAGCGLEAPYETVSSESSPIRSEQPGGVADAIYRHYDNADVAKSSYASPSLFFPGGGSIVCSAAMIGPNLMLTAGHCGFGPWTASFMLYPHQNTTDKNYEDFHCEYLVSTWHSSDLVLHYCSPNSSGVNPGDKYGYFDLDTQDPVVGQHVYSIWANPLDTPAPSQYDVRFYSEGTVTSTTNLGTFTTDPAGVRLVGGVPDYTTSTQRPIGIATDQWCNGGASGSATINAINHRYAIGPLSQGATDGRGRYALSMNQYLRDGTVDGRDPAQINTSLFATLGLDASPYIGVQHRIDANADQHIDLQVELERMRGEAARGWYSLSFASARQNALWTTGIWSSATYDADAGIARLHHTWVGFTDDGISHDRLNLAPGTYRLAWQAQAASVGGSAAPSSSSNMWIGFVWSTGESGSWIATNPAAGYAQNAVNAIIPTGVTGARLVIRLRDAIDLNVAAVSVIRSGEVMDFDTHDKRLFWRNDITGGRGLIVPYVPTWAAITGASPGVGNWVARVKSDPQFPGGFPLRNRQLAMQAGHVYRICFQAVVPEDADPTQTGRVRVIDPSGVIFDGVFSPSSSGWGGFCTGSFAPRSNDVNLQFGISTSGSYMLDDIRIDEVQ